MSLETNTSKTLRVSVYASIIVIVIGLIAKFAFGNEDVLWFGILLLIISPLLGVIVTTVSLYIEKDWKWVKVALILIVISAVGMLLK